MSSTFCALPWKHLSANPDGAATLCCVSDFTHSKNRARDFTSHSTQYKSLNVDSIESTMNCDYFKEVRIQMLNDQQPDACRRCYREESSLNRSKRLEENERLGFTEEMARFITSDDGTVPVDFSFVELRLGNLCNIKCRTCNPASSTSWVSEYMKLQKEVPFVTHYDKSINSSWTENDSFWDDLLSHCGNLQLLYINGGEPTLVEKHWKFLERLIDRGLHKQVTLWYSINMTNLPDKLLDIWKNFKGVRVSCSIDDLGERNDYIRTGTNWNTVIQNLDKLQSLPWIDTSICQTISWMNVAYLPEFHNFMDERKLHVHMNFVHDPAFLSARHLPTPVKDKILKSCSTLSDWKRALLKSQLSLDCEIHQLINGLKFNDVLDRNRKTKFKDCFERTWEYLNGPKLDESNFCLIPWTHLHIWPNGNTYMCCTSDPKDMIGKIDDSIKIVDVWNSDKMKSNRISMLNNERLPECARCFEIEKAGGKSQRLNQIKMFPHHLPMVFETNHDGAVNELNMPYVDIRFSNICNLRCRTCGPELSSRWHADIKLLEPNRNDPAIRTPTTNPEILWDQVCDILPRVESIYFAGGEPMITPEHYRILQKLVDDGQTSVKLMYNTNFTVFKYKGTSVFDLWKKFKDVDVGASLDSFGTLAEYIRNGTDWDQIEASRLMMMEECPHVNFYLNVTVSVFNFSSIPEFHKNWTTRGLIRPFDINLNILTNPDWYRVHIMSEDYRNGVIGKYNEHIAWLNTLDDPTGKIKSTIGQFKFVVKYLQGPQLTNQLPEFLKLTRELDAIRGESFSDTFLDLALELKK